MALTEKHRRFVEAYLFEPHARSAAIRAGYSKHTADSQASRLLRHVGIAAAIAKAQAGRAERVQMDADEILRDLAEISRTNLSDVMTWDGESATPKDSKELTPAQAKAIKRVRVKKTIRKERGSEDILETIDIEVELHDQIRTRELIARHLGLLKDGASVQVPEGTGAVHIHFGPAVPPAESA